MKNAVCILLCACISNLLYAQDLIITKDGEPIAAYDVEIGANTIIYKIDTLPASKYLSIGCSKIFMIKFKDGSKRFFEESKVNPRESVDSPEAITTPISIIDTIRNNELISSYNSNMYEYNIIDKEREAGAIFGQFAPTLTSQLASKDIELSFNVGDYNYYSKYPKSGMLNLISYELMNQCIPCVIVSIKNKSNNTVFIDLGNTFIKRGESAESYYTPAAVSATNATTTGVGVNIGSVTNIKALNGVSVGGAKSNSTTSITYTQRYITVPPKSTKSLELKMIIPEGTESQYKNIFLKYFGKYPSTHMRGVGSKESGQVDIWDEDNSPIKWGFFTTYSFTEDMESTGTLFADFYLKQGVYFYLSKSYLHGGSPKAKKIDSSINEFIKSNSPLWLEIRIFD